MNQQVNKDNEPLIPAPQAGGIEDSIMGGTPNQIEIDKDLSDKVTNAIDKASEEGNDNKDDSKDVAASKSNNEGYEPAKEFTEFLNQEIQADEQGGNPDDQQQRESPSNNGQPDLSVLRDLLADNPHMAPAVKEALASKGINLDAPGDPETLQRLEGMQSTINQLADMMMTDRDSAKGQELFESVNDTYLDVVKNVPDYQRTVVDLFNNALMRDYDLRSINRDMLVDSNKAITSELGNMFKTWAKAEGYTKSKGVPPSMNSNLGEIAPPPAAENTQSNRDNRPVNAFADEDARFTRNVNNLFSQ